jgi:microcystin degradation protein MlrC
MKIFAAGIATETNTFTPIPTTLDDFIVQRGRSALHGCIDYPNLNLSEVWGVLARARGDTFVFGSMAFAQPSGITVSSAYEALREEILTDLRDAMPVDVVLLMLHGAMIADGYEDCEEDIIGCVRRVVGPSAVIGVELDLHCHLTKSKIAQANIVVTFKEYPHVDANDRARELFELAIAAKLGKIRPSMALFDCRMVGIYPTTRQPMRGFVDAMMQAERRQGVLALSFGHGFQFADIPAVGAKVLAITDNDPTLAQQVAEDFGRQVYGLRQEISFDLLSLSTEKALSTALMSQRRPVVVADQSDNAGGGAPGDATFALRWLLDHRGTEVAMAAFYDPEVVRIAKKAGKGARLPVRVGGKLGRLSGDPIDLEVTVLSIIDNYRYVYPMQSGEVDLIPTGSVVALRSSGIDIVVSSERCQCYSPSIFSDLGIDPQQKRVLVAKSTQHFYAAFAPIASEVIYMAGPGAVTPDPKQVPYRRVNTSRLYPWIIDPLAETNPS